MNTNYVLLAPLDCNHFVTDCQFAILFPDDFSVIQESDVTATSCTGAPAFRMGSATPSANYMIVHRILNFKNPSAQEH